MQGTLSPFGLYFLFIYGSFVDGVDGTRFKYMKIEDLEGHTCPGNDTLFDNERSLVQCASKCSETPTCSGVVIQPQDFRCIGCKDNFLTSDRAPLLSGTQYYRLQNTRYRVVEEEMTWFEAKAYCESLGARLADIKTEEEEKYIENYVISAYTDQIWLGATDKEHEGTFLWQDDTNVSDGYTNWNTGQPDNKNTDWGFVAHYGNFRHEGNCFCGNDACGVPNKTVTRVLEVPYRSVKGPSYAYIFYYVKRVF